MSDPLQMLEQIIEAWWDLEVEEQNHSWKLTAVNRAHTWSPNKDLLHPVYVLTRKGDPFHLQRPHGVLEVSWGHRYWITAIALSKWNNTYHCVGLLKNACGPMLSQCCAMWCDGDRLREELVECHIGSFVQVHIETFFNDLVRIDLATFHWHFFFVPMPCALEALTVINPLFRLSLSKGETKT